MRRRCQKQSALVLMVLISLCQLSCSSGPSTPPAAAIGPAPEFQVVVYGGTPGGTMAAISAANEGLKVALVEPGNHIGGMLSGGLGATDSGNKSIIGGKALEYFQRVGSIYGQEISWQFEPHVAETTLRNWLDQSGVKIFLGHHVLNAKKNSSKISSIETDDGSFFTANVFIDASYEGDLMAKSGVSYTLGRESCSVYGESLAGRQSYSQDHQFSDAVPAYDSSNQLLPLVTPADSEIPGDGDLKIQAYNYRLCLTANKDNQVPFPKPPGYDPKRYELLRSYLSIKGGSLSLSSLMSLTPVPNGKTDTNNSGPISTDFIGGNWDYPEADYAKREEIKQEHRSYVQGFLYFLANDPSVPSQLQNETRNWGLAKDEFTDTGNWPYQIYVREARRMVGAYVMTQADLQTNLTKNDSIGMGSYNSDSHHVQRFVTSQGTVLNEGDVEVPVTPYEIPYSSITPKETECENLLVTVCVSSSHVAFSSLRMEPQFMIIGQAAGEAAFLAIRDNCSLQRVDVAQLRSRLRSQSQILGWSDVKTAISIPSVGSTKIDRTALVATSARATITLVATSIANTVTLVRSRFLNSLGDFRKQSELFLSNPNSADATVAIRHRDS